MKLELKHLAGYLPYGLKVFRENKSVPSDTFVIKGATKENVFLSESGLVVVDIDRIKPILRPLSDLTKHCDDLGFVPMDKLAEIAEVVCLQYSIEFFETSTKYLPNWIIEKLLEWHFDIHGLIENNLAIDINTL